MIRLPNSAVDQILKFDEAFVDVKVKNIAATFGQFDQSASLIKLVIVKLENFQFH